jgi:hypothetical protein
MTEKGEEFFIGWHRRDAGPRDASVTLDPDFPSARKALKHA